MGRALPSSCSEDPELAVPAAWVSKLACFWVWICCLYLSCTAVTWLHPSSSSKGAASKCVDLPIHSTNASAKCKHIARAVSFMRPQCPCLSQKNKYAKPEPSTWTCSSSLKAGSLFNTCSTMPAFHEKAGGRGLLGWFTIITSNYTMYSSVGCDGSVTVDSAAVRASLNPWTVNLAASSCGMYSLDSLGEYISPDSSSPSHSIVCFLDQLSNISYQMSRPLGHSFDTWMERAPCLREWITWKLC